MNIKVRIVGLRKPYPKMKALETKVFLWPSESQSHSPEASLETRIPLPQRGNENIFPQVGHKT